MENRTKLADLTAGQQNENYYLLKLASVKVASNGKPFLTGEIADKDGSMPIIMWDYAGAVSPEDVGKVVKVRGMVSEYKDKTQLLLSGIRTALKTDNYDITELVPSAPINVQECLDYIDEIIKSIADTDYQTVCIQAMNLHRDEFANIPAAKSVHHAFLSGLLMHTTNMLRMADCLSSIKLYGNHINRSLMLTGTLLHDIAKTREYVFSETGLVTDYSKDGMLLGHLVMGAEEVQDIANAFRLPQAKIDLLKHMILSHHGRPEYGAAVAPQIIEAELLHYIDMVDSRAEIYIETMEQMEEDSFSDRIFGLEHKVYKHS